MLISLTIIAILALFRHYIAEIYTSEAHLVELVSSIMPFMLMNFVFDGL
jgi:Na+-driven multidrug efflux pump